MPRRKLLHDNNTFCYCVVFQNPTRMPNFRLLSERCPTGQIKEINNKSNDGDKLQQ